MAEDDALTGVDRALLDYLDDVGDYADRLRQEASRALTRAVRQAADFGWSQRRIAAAIGRSQPEVARLLRATQPPLVEYAITMPDHRTSATSTPEPDQPSDNAAPEPTPTERKHSTLTWVLRDKRDEIVRIAAENGAHNVRVFGSVARGEDDADSDIDFLVDFDEGVGLFDRAGLMLALEQSLTRPVDVVSAGALMPRVARHALPEAVTL
ncbi:nucleotidyltransferase family protein [Cellulomonas sp. NPDC089187]|uniref:nucleotidyltransferase family protein n=1 Tax=Cellulomonas sp. NPDC089187 TaxID=3154970 RepID=UPI003442370F